MPPPHEGRRHASARNARKTPERKPRRPDRSRADSDLFFGNVQRKLRTRVSASVLSSLPRSLKCAIRSPDLASSSGASSRWRSDLLLLRPLHGYWDSPEISSGSLNAGLKPERCVFQTRKHMRFICACILSFLHPLVNRFRLSSGIFPARNGFLKSRQENIPQKKSCRGIFRDSLINLISHYLSCRENAMA